MTPLEEAQLGISRIARQERVDLGQRSVGAALLKELLRAREVGSDCSGRNEREHAQQHQQSAQHGPYLHE